MCASPDIFAHLTHLLMNLAGGKLCAVLEVRLDVFTPKDLHSHQISFLEFCSVESSTSQAVRGITLNVFQGGYNLTSLPQSVCQTVQTLLGDPAPPPAGLGGPCSRSVRTRPLFCMSVFYDCSEFDFLFVVHSSPFTVCGQLIGLTGPASNTQV